MITAQMQKLVDNEVVLTDTFSMEWEEVRNLLNNKSESGKLLQLKKEYSRVGKYLVPIKFSKKYLDGTKIKYYFKYEMKGNKII